jgi:hypothetical protein
LSAPRQTRKEKQHIVSVAYVQGYIYYFDAEGSLDYKFSRDQRRLLHEACDQARRRKVDEKVYDASIAFASKRFEETFTWVPEPGVIKRIKKQFLAIY